MKITLTQAKCVAIKLHLNLNVVPIDVFRNAMLIELEHGKKYATTTNVTNDNLLLTGKIALAHLIEYPDYYKRLNKMEIEAEKYWQKRDKPNVIF